MYYYSIYLEGLRKATKSLNQDSPSPASERLQTKDVYFNGAASRVPHKLFVHQI